MEALDNAITDILAFAATVGVLVPLTVLAIPFLLLGFLLSIPAWLRENSAAAAELTQHSIRFIRYTALVLKEA